MVKIKKQYCIMILLICAFLLVGCGNSTKNEKKIKKDLSQSSILDDFSAMGYADCKIKSVKIDKRKTEKKETDDVFCTVKLKNEDVEIIQKYELGYNFYTEGGWILDDILQSEDMEVKPIKGVNDDIVKTDIENLKNYRDFTIGKHDTDLKTFIDKISVNVNTDTNLCKISGDVTLEYAFTEGKWMLTSSTPSENYKEEWNFAGTWMHISAGNRGLNIVTVRNGNGNQYIFESHLINFFGDDEFEDSFYGEQRIVYPDFSQDRFFEDDSITDYVFDPDSLSFANIYNYEKISDERLNVNDYMKDTYNRTNIRVVEEEEEPLDEETYGEDSSIENEKTEKNIADITDYYNINASSELEGYSIENLTDKDTSTAWVEGMENYGQGETISFEPIRDTPVITSIVIHNGFQKSKELLDKNSQPKSLDLIINGDQVGTINLNQAKEVGDCTEYTLEKPIKADSMYLRIADVYQGTKYSDTCISEIAVNGYFE